MTLDLITGLALLGSCGLGAGAMLLRRRIALRRLKIGEKLVTVSAMPPVEERAFDVELFAAAIVEQLRREAAHPGPRYRADQRVRAVQQRLSRKWGAYAFSPHIRRRVEEALSQ